jgi:hypothetical protein
MIDDITQSLSTNLGHTEDANKNLNSRVKVFSKINRWTDNFLRIDIKLMIVDFIRMFIVFIFIGLLYYNNYTTKNLTIKGNFMQIGEQLSYISKQVNIIFINNYSQKVNTLIEQFELENVLSFYPIQKIDMVADESIIDKPLLYYMYFVFIGLIIYFLLIFYQYYAQKNLFASTLLNMKVDLIMLPFFYNRNKNGYFYMRLIRHQKQKNVFSSLSQLIVSNLFNLKELNEDDKLDVKLVPKKWFLYDYIELSYTLNSQTSKVKKEPKKTNKNKEKIDIEKTNNKIDEVLEQVENSNNSELELINLEELENLNI